MRLSRSSLVAIILAAIALSQTSSQLLTPEIRRVGGRLACLCGSCKNTVGDCPMLECHYAKPARQKILAMQTAGSSDDQIVQRIVDDRGLQALAAPPTSGFGWVAWLMPWVAVALGLGAIWLVLRRYRAKRTPVPELPPEVLSRYRENIEKDLAKLE